VSIGKRLVDMVRSNLTALLDRTGGEGEASRIAAPIEELSDEDLERELLRRRARRSAAERAADSALEDEAWEEVERATRDGSERYRTVGRRSGTYRRPSGGPASAPGGARRHAAPVHDPRLAQLYAQLECPYGADFTTVRKHYRALMLKYHPDMHSGRPDKQRLATELSQRLTLAYNELRRLLTNTPH
jgi:DnaJ-domain-containing protein 1